MASSNAERRQREAEALSRATASEKIQLAKSLQESYLAEKEAELARAARERASREADVIVQSEITKRKIEIDAEAEAERTRRIAKGEADAILLMKEAEAKVCWLSSKDKPKALKKSSRQLVAIHAMQSSC